MEEASKARSSGADALLIKKELVDQFLPDNLSALVNQLQYISSGDD